MTASQAFYLNDLNPSNSASLYQRGLHNNTYIKLKFMQQFIFLTVYFPQVNYEASFAMS